MTRRALLALAALAAAPLSVPLVAQDRPAPPPVLRAEETTSKAGYFVAHSTMMYVLDATGRTRRRLRYQATVDEVVAAVRELLD